MDNKIKDAVLGALQDPKVVSAFADSIQKQIVKNKTNPSNLEEELVTKHVVFAKEGSPTGTFMTTKEVTLAILEFDGDLVIKPRVFGKALITACQVTKKSNLGQVYLIETIVEEVTPELIESFDSAAQTEAAEEVEVETEETETDVRAELIEMNKKGLKQFIKENELKVKIKGLDEDEIVPLILEALGVDESEEEEVTDEEIIAELEALKRKGLKKFIRDQELDVEVTDNMDELNIRIAILNALGIEQAEAESEEEVEVNGAYLGQLSREELEAFIKENELDIKVKSKHSDLKICGKILEALGQENPLKEEEKEEPKKKKNKKKNKAKK